MPSSSPVQTASPDGNDLAEDLFRSHYPALVAYAHRLTGSTETAEDLASETLLRVIDRLGSGMEPASVRAYLIRSVRNSFLDQLRRNDREARELHRASAVQSGTSADPADAAVAAADFLHCMQRLSPRYRTILWLTVIEDLTLAEVARAMDLSSSSSAAVLAHRARQAFLKEYTSTGRFRRPALASGAQPKPLPQARSSRAAAKTPSTRDDG